MSQLIVNVHFMLQFSQEKKQDGHFERWLCIHSPLPWLVLDIRGKG